MDSNCSSVINKKALESLIGSQCINDTGPNDLLVRLNVHAFKSRMCLSTVYVSDSLGSIEKSCFDWVVTVKLFLATKENTSLDFHPLVLNYMAFSLLMVSVGFWC